LLSLDLVGTRFDLVFLDFLERVVFLDLLEGRLDLVLLESRFDLSLFKAFAIVRMDFAKVFKEIRDFVMLEL
jgi:hypothetical protein